MEFASLRTLARVVSACRDVLWFSLSVMALKVAKAVGGSAKAVLRPALLCRSWEVRVGSGLQGQPRRSPGVLAPRWGRIGGLRYQSVLEPDWLWAPRGAGRELRAGIDWPSPLSVRGLAKVGPGPPSPGVCVLCRGSFGQVGRVSHCGPSVASLTSLWDLSRGGHVS